MQNQIRNLRLSQTMLIVKGVGDGEVDFGSEFVIRGQQTDDHGEVWEKIRD